jgi:hypothetical protein
LLFEVCISPPKPSDTLENNKDHSAVEREAESKEPFPSDLSPDNLIKYG